MDRRAQPGIFLNCTELKSAASSRAWVNVTKMAMSICCDAMPLVVPVVTLNGTSMA